MKTVQVGIFKGHGQIILLLISLNISVDVIRVPKTVVQEIATDSYKFYSICLRSAEKSHQN